MSNRQGNVSPDLELTGTDAKSERPKLDKFHCTGPATLPVEAENNPRIRTDVLIILSSKDPLSRSLEPQPMSWKHAWPGLRGQTRSSRQGPRESCPVSSVE